MGCKGSKLDDQEAVALCRARADLLAAAVRHRYALADAHAALAASIDAVADPLHGLLLLLRLQAHDSPRLALPSDRKGGGNRRRLPPRGHSSSPHLKFGSSSSGSDPASSPPRHVAPEYQQHQHPTLPQTQYGYGYAAQPQPAFAYPAAPASSLQFYYARSRPPPASVAVAQRAPRPPERVYFGSFDAALSGGYTHQYHHAAQAAASGGYTHQYHHAAQAQPAAPQRASAPPSPPKAGAWDFLNVFESYDSYGVDDGYYYDDSTAAAAYTPSRSSREVREEEGIPDLEDDDEEDDTDVIVKDVSGDYSAGPGSGGARSRRSSVGGASGIAEFDEPENVITHKDVVLGEARRRQLANRNVSVPAAAAPVQRAVGSADGADVAGEIKAQLVRAADAARELAPLLEVGRPSYQGRSSVYHSSSRVMSAISASHLGCKDVDLLDVGLVDKVADSRSLSSALEKLYFWERKLYSEVKAEEKMRLLIAKNSKRLKLLDQRGAEPQKIDATRNLLRKLSTKIRISVRVIAKISRKINKLRDEELWPQVNALVVGLVKMWQDKLDSYKTQCQVISGVENWTSVESGGSSRDLAIELELELIKWIINFSSWVNTQRNFAKALNGWLALCLNYEPEEACNGASSYSPGSIGAPLVFVICNKWSQAMDRISEKDVVTAMQALVSSVRQMWEQQNLDQSEQVIAIREREKWTKILERKTQDINKEVDELNKKLALVPSRHSLHMPRTVHIYEAHCVEASNLHINLSLVLQALESFAASSLQAFQEVLRCAEGTSLPRDNVRRRKKKHSMNS